MTMFTSPTGLQSQYHEVLPGDIASITDKANSILALNFRNYGRYFFIDNTLRDGGNIGADISLALLHPESELTNDNKLFWLNIGSPRTLNFSVGDAPGIHFLPGARVYAWLASGVVTPTQGKLSLFAI